jgi:hypothetical protein
LISKEKNSQNIFIVSLELVLGLIGEIQEINVFEAGIDRDKTFTRAGVAEDPNFVQAADQVR